MLSFYRLCDLVLQELTAEEQMKIVDEHPDSLGSKYILLGNKSSKKERFDTFVNMVLQCIEENKNILPTKIENSTVLHIRIGDSLNGTRRSEKMLKPFEIEYLKTLIPDDHNKLYVIGKQHYQKDLSYNNYTKTLHQSNMYLLDVMSNLNAIHYNGGNPDIDLCCAVKAKYFIQGKGMYSLLIMQIRNELNIKRVQDYFLINKPLYPTCKSKMQTI